MPRLSNHLIQRRAQFSVTVTGHCYQLASDLILWKIKQTCGKPAFPDVISKDTDIPPDDPWLLAFGRALSLGHGRQMMMNNVLLPTAVAS